MAYRGSEADKKQKAEYSKKHLKTYSISLYDTKDNDMIDHMEKNRPCCQYLKRLVREDMEKNRS